jgi:hypothetical protein
VRRFQVTEEADLVIPDPWTKKAKKTLGGIAFGCLFTVILMLAWIGPAIKEAHSGHHAHAIHMHGFAGEVGGLVAVAEGADHLYGASGRASAKCACASAAGAGRASAK